MGVSSRTYRFSTQKNLKPCPISRRKAKLPSNRSRSPTSESPSAPRTPRPSTRLAPRSAAERKTSPPEAPSPRSRSRDHDLCQRDECESPPERRHAVRVPRPGTDSRFESTSESSSSCAARARRTRRAHPPRTISKQHHFVLNFFVDKFHKK